jgi:hypothetical protein
MTKQDEIEWLAAALAGGGQALTLDNARLALAEFTRRAPEAWILTPDDPELPGLWNEFIKAEMR